MKTRLRKQGSVGEADADEIAASCRALAADLLVALKG